MENNDITETGKPDITYHDGDGQALRLLGTKKMSCSLALGWRGVYAFIALKNIAEHCLIPM